MVKKEQRKKQMSKAIPKVRFASKEHEQFYCEMLKKFGINDSWFFLYFGYPHILRICYKPPIGLAKQNENNGITPISERT